MSERLLGSSRRARPLTATEPSSVFVLKSLLHPVVAVGCLLLCLVIWNQSLYGPYFLIAVVTFVASSHVLGVVELQRRPGRYFTLLSFIDLLLRWAVVIAFLAALLHLSRLTDRFEWHMLGSWALMTPLCLWIGENVAQFALTHTHSSSPALRKAVIIGLTEPGLQLEQQLNRDPSLRIQVEGYFEDRQAERLPAAGQSRILGRPSDLPDFVRRHDINVAYVTLPMTRHTRVIEMLEALRDSTVSVYFVPNLFAFDLVQARFDVLGGIPVVAVCESPFYGASGIAKRLCDLIIASLVLLACSPLLLLVALGVRLSSPGPIVFKQRRYGLDGRQILIYKFRSMTVTEDGATQYRQVTTNRACHALRRLHPQTLARRAAAALQCAPGYAEPRRAAASCDRGQRAVIASSSPVTCCVTKSSPALPAGRRSMVTGVVMTWSPCASASNSTWTTCGTGRWLWTSRS